MNFWQTTILAHNARLAQGTYVHCCINTYIRRSTAISVHPLVEYWVHFYSIPTITDTALALVRLVHPPSPLTPWSPNVSCPKTQVAYIHRYIHTQIHRCNCGYQELYCLVLLG